MSRRDNQYYKQRRDNGTINIKMKGSQFKARAFLGTHNNPKVPDIQDWLKLWHTKAGARYVNGQLEKGENGTPHI